MASSKEGNGSLQLPIDPPPYEQHANIYYGLAERKRRARKKLILVTLIIVIIASILIYAWLTCNRSPDTYTIEENKSFALWRKFFANTDEE